MFIIIIIEIGIMINCIDCQIFTQHNDYVFIFYFISKNNFYNIYIYIYIYMISIL
jgi:hypothetical protein